MIITGGAGFIGTHLQKVTGGTVIDLKTGSDLFDLNDLDDDRVVVHLAAVSSIPDSVRDPKKTWQTNIVGLQHMIDLCKEADAKLIFASSSACANALSPYAFSKLWGETMIERSGIRYQILRFGNVYGEGDTKSAIYHFKGDEIIKIYGDGSIKRSFIHVSDVVAAIIAAVSDDSGNQKDTHLIGHENKTILEVAKLFNKPIRFESGREWDAPDLAMSWQVPNWWKLMPQVKIEDYANGVI
jgi:UDP-glucose 4-epimerase